MNITEEGKCQNNSMIGKFCIIEVPYLSENVKVGNYCEIRKGCKIGQNTTFGSRCTLSENTEIGENCIIKYGFVATDTPDLTNPKLKKPCKIGNNVLIGANVCGYVQIGNENQIKVGVTIRNRMIIGDRNLIGQGSNVVEFVDNDKKIKGNPAK